MNRYVNSVSGRLSLRPPQRESLEILARVADIIPLEKERDTQAALEVIRSEFGSVTDFERDFPSLCFALATGVGKTRLMGAFVAYLHLAKGVRHFFVLAPNLTIYNKLIADFTPNHPKYVLQGIAEFATNPPEVITGDNYESGRGVREADLFGETGIHINIFNISKINSEVRGGNAPRIKRLSEYIGQSYFDYLAGLDDLVLLMDESHRYRASAGVRAINELKPVIGLELTATPQIETARGAIPFKNIIYSYPLPAALDDGFVKEPVVATRENFDARNYTADQLEELKLKDGVRIHEATKVELEVYARQNDRPLVKPFMLVVAQDTEHANSLVSAIKDDAFFEGRYKDRVITVHSNQRGEERDETVEKLLSVENPQEPTEIVVHVNMLKEGWDVTNLYTIVPLRAANSRTLVEQSIGRGLRLPYGKRVGVNAVDRLTIVAHDKFQEIIDEANNPNSIIKKGVIIRRDVAAERKETVIIEPDIVTRIAPSTTATTQAASGNGQPAAGAAQFATASGRSNTAQQETLVFTTPAEQKVAQVTLDVIKQFETLPRSADLKSPQVQAKIVSEVAERFSPVQGELEGVAEQPNIEQIVAKTAELFVERTIDIPRIVVQPVGEVSYGFSDFDLDTSSVNLQPVDHQILIASLQTNARERLDDSGNPIKEERPENYLVRGLIDFADISYDDHADLLYKLAGQLVAHLRSYLTDEEAVHNVLQFNQQRLAALIHTQMQAHHWEHATGYEAYVSRGFQTLRSNSYSAPAGEQVRDFREPVEERQYIRGMLFGGFRRCLYPVQKFDSDPERRFAVILENEADESLKWFKPAKGQFRIYYRQDTPYEPDFVVETSTAKYLCEPKRASEMTDEDVLEKARAAIAWCERATRHELEHGGKPWSYLLIPHNQITDTRTLQGLAATFTLKQA
ncbi:MAG: DEAD/DEAH box helicase family protein [Acidobacteriota bacterium]|nr:DEAD/DEAH box helicase family protein [Acidobacteriota bacterium]